MTKATLVVKRAKALVASIGKWERIVNQLKGPTKYDKIVENGAEDCPCCRLFYDNSCYGCPVRDYSGESMCRGTPYVEWNNEFPKFQQGPALHPDFSRTVVTSLAKKELKFLKKVLEKEKKTTLKEAQAIVQFWEKTE